MKALTKDTFAHAIPQRADGANYFAFYSSGEFANGRVDYPVKLTAIGFSMFRKILVVNLMKEAGSTIRLRDFVSWSDK